MWRVPVVPAMTYRLAKEDVFHTLQGEGHLLGQPQTFIRLAGCSVGCANCDTDYRFDHVLEVDELIDRVERETPDEIRQRWVWITGGEPADQPLAPLVRGLQQRGFSVAVATSGTKAISIPVDWLSVSPHGNLAIRAGNEVKIVPGLNGLNAERWIEENDDSIDFWLRFLQPLEGDRRGIERCLKLQRRFPHWGVTLQAHKLWGLR